MRTCLLRVVAAVGIGLTYACVGCESPGVASDPTAFGPDDEATRLTNSLMGSRPMGHAYLKWWSEGLVAVPVQDATFRDDRARALRGSGNAIAVLTDALDHQSETVRRRAARALALVGSRVAVKGLIARLTRQDESPWVRLNCAYALGFLGNLAAVGPLRVAADDEYRLIRHQAVVALGMIGDSTAMAVLRSIRERSQEWRTRQLADSFLKGLVVGGNIGGYALVFGEMERSHDFDY